MKREQSGTDRSGHSPLASNERGVSMLELAIALPWIAILVFGMIHFGLTLRELRHISDAAKYGARLASQYSGTVGPLGTVCNDVAYSNGTNTVCNDGNFESNRFTCGTPPANPGGIPVNSYAIWATCHFLNNMQLGAEHFEVCGEYRSLPNQLDSTRNFQAVRLTLRRRPGTQHCGIFCWQNYFPNLRPQSEAVFMLEGTCS